MKKIVIIVVDREDITNEEIKRASQAFTMSAESSVLVNIIDEKDMIEPQDNPVQKRIENALKNIITICSAGDDLKTTFWSLVASKKITPEMVEQFIENPVLTIKVLKQYKKQELMDLFRTLYKIKDLVK